MRAGAAERLGDLLLELVGQEIEVAARVQVQHGADSQEEVFRFVQPSGVAAVLARDDVGRGAA